MDDVKIRDNRQVRRQHLSEIAELQVGMKIVISKMRYGMNMDGR
jgi:hypothetical protein